MGKGIIQWSNLIAPKAHFIGGVSMPPVSSILIRENYILIEEPPQR